MSISPHLIPLQSTKKCLTEQDVHILSESKARLTLFSVLIESLLSTHKDRDYFPKQGPSLNGQLQQKWLHLWQQDPLLGRALINHAASIIFWTSRTWQIQQLLYSLSSLFNSIWQTQGCRTMCFSACPASHNSSNSWRMFRSSKKRGYSAQHSEKRRNHFHAPIRAAFACRAAGECPLMETVVPGCSFLHLY